MSNKKRKQTILFDKVMGEVAFAAFAPLSSLIRKKDQAAGLKRILIIKTGGIGDYLLSIPAFKKIRAAHPEAEITLFIFNRNKICLEFYNEFDKVTVIDDAANLLSFMASGQRFDLSIDFDQYRKIPSVLSIFSLAPTRIGFDHADKGKAYTHKVPYRMDEYEAQSFMNLLEPLGLSKKIMKDDLLFPAASVPKIAKSVAVYACAMKEENRLPIEKWKEIISSKGNGFTYYFIGGKADKERYDALQAELPGFTIERTDGTLSLMGSIDLLGRCEAMLSEDGGTYHMGVVAGTKITGYWLHGEENMRKWSSPDADNILIN